MNIKLSLFLVLFFEFLIQDSSSSYYQQSNVPQISQNNILSTHNHRPEYGLETVYTASAYIPTKHNGPPIRVVPEKEKTQYYFVTTNTTTINIPKSSIPSDPTPLQQSFRLRNYNNAVHSNNQTQRQQTRIRRTRHRAGDCIKCPPEKIMIAQKGLDGVLVDQPKLFSCQNRAILNTAFNIETLFGSSFKFLLPHGTHSFHGRIKNKKTGRVVQSCILRYKVIVQQCGRFFPQDENIRSKCDPGYIWGSKCSFTCRQGYLSTDKPMTCGDSLQWEGEEPECLSEPPIDESKSCDFLGIPDNGRFSCEYPSNVKSDNFDNELVTPEGTLCRIKCHRNYEIPVGWESYSVVKCEQGRWNSTVPNLCQPRRRY